MAILGANKLMLLNQVKNNPNIPLQKLVDLLNHYEDLQPQDFKGYISNTLYDQLLSYLAELIEKDDWEELDRNKDNYDKLRDYKLKHPNSVHLSELDDLMWRVTKREISVANLERYLIDWPAGRHTDEANQALNEYKEWQKVLSCSN